MRFKGVLVIALIAFLCFPITQGQAGSFTDNFDDGNADGWVFPYYPDQTQFPGGAWSVEDGVLVQRWTGDNNRALVDNLVLSSQVIATHVTNFGYAGVVLWHQENHQSWVAINLNTGYGKIIVHELIDGVSKSYFHENFWIDSRPYDLRVDADSTSGELDIYVYDTLIFTYQTSTPYRTGSSGLWSGNEVGYFDNFSLTSDDIAPVPEPSTMLLLASGLVGILGMRKKVRK